MSMIADVQSAQDTRNLPIQQVGIKHLRYPVRIANKNHSLQTSVGEYSLSVALPADRKGTHMSRFIEALESLETPLSMQSLAEITQQFCERLDADAAQFQVRFCYFRSKQAPKSQVISKLDYNVEIECLQDNGNYQRQLSVEIPVKTLCPASKAMSDYGAHNQRSYITVSVEVLSDTLHIDDLIDAVENHGSAEIFSVLKRADEKFITESAYDNPKFVEDLVRDLALSLQNLKGIGHFSIECENIESIHNHSAFAYIEGQSHS